MHSISKIMFRLKNSFRNLICCQTPIAFSTAVTQYQPPHNSASNPFPHTVSPTNLNCFLKQSGLSDAQIKDLISRRPRYFSIKDETLKPKINLLQELGLSGSALADLILSNPSILLCGMNKTLIPTIHFLRSFLHSNENIVRALKKCSWLLSVSFQQTISYNAEILRQCGVSDKQISLFLVNHPRLFTQRPDRLKDHVSQAEKLGLKEGSGSFIYAISTLSSLSKDTLRAKFDMYKNYGWSESDIVSAFRKDPGYLRYSEQKVKAAMDFFVGELGYNPKDLVLMPTLFGYSLEKRLKPRHEVLKILKSRGLKLNCKLVSIAVLTEKKFLEQYVLKYVKEVPDLQEAYMGSST